MARNLVVNGVTYNNVESLEMTDENGEKVLYTEGVGGTTEMWTFTMEDGYEIQKEVVIA